jgi:hypothetical protein
MPLARRGLENDSAPSEQVRRPTGDAAFELVERSRPKGPPMIASSYL